MAATTPPRVRDFTGTERTLHVEVASGDAFELLLSLYAIGGDEVEADFEVGSEWFEGIRERAGTDLLDRLRKYGDWSVWIALIGEVYAMGAPHTTDHLLEHLGGLDAVQMRRGLIESAPCSIADELDVEALEALAVGTADPASYTEGWCEKCPGLQALLALPPAESQEVLIGLLRSFAEAKPVPEGTVGVLERDADHKRSLARRMDPERLVEKTTNGITVAVTSDLAGVVLVPTVVLRPWVIIAERGATRIFCYSVAEENLGLDPDTPPAWLVQFYKALGDERRLKILRRLAEGPASFSELVTLLDLAKSTVHHHIRQLRTAGVVRVTVGDAKELSLRLGTVPEAARLLEGFLGTPTQEH